MLPVRQRGEPRPYSHRAQSIKNGGLKKEAAPGDRINTDGRANNQSEKLPVKVHKERPSVPFSPTSLTKKA